MVVPPHQKIRVLEDETEYLIILIRDIPYIYSFLSKPNTGSSLDGSEVGSILEVYEDVVFATPSLTPDTSAAEDLDIIPCVSTASRAACSFARLAFSSTSSCG